MAAEWINFEALCLRVPGKSPRTLRRMIKDKVISCRQLKRGGRLEFNWVTVERELSALETPSLAVRSGRVRPVADESVLEQLTGEVRALVDQVNLLTKLVGANKETIG